MYLEVAPHFGMIIRKESLREKEVSRDRLIYMMDRTLLQGENDFIISFGPFFGEDGLKRIESELNSAGLSYLDDYIHICIFVPPWLSIGVKSTDGEFREGIQSGNSEREESR